MKRASPERIKPMLATLVDKPPKEKGWLYEIKWDGYRALSFCNGEKVNITSRNNKSFNDKFYPLMEALQKMKLQAVLDGEIVVLKDNGVASFGALQNWRSQADGELLYYVFDLLWLKGQDLTALPLSERKKLLETLPLKGIIKVNQSFSVDPIKFLKKAKKMGLEGIMAKRADSQYCPGERTHTWLKIKILKRHEVVIGGYTKNKDSPKLFSALLVGVYEKGALHYTGKIGTGFTAKMEQELMRRFKPLIRSKSPFAETLSEKVTWLTPKLVCEVSYTELTDEGLMRHPSFKGMREDKAPKEVYAEVDDLLDPQEKTQTKVIQGNELQFSNLTKVFWPKEGYTKRDLLNYYYQVAPYIIPYLKDRPQSLNRFPDGIQGFNFYQKDVTAAAPEWIKQFPYTPSTGEHKNFLVVQNEADLLWMANLGAIEMNPWSSTIYHPDHPDWCLIDIDPSEKNSFDQVVETAQATKEVLDGLKIEGYCKTSGATGLHIYIPLKARYSYEQSQLFGRLIATEVNAMLPDITTFERTTKKRHGKIYVDFLQNRPQATLAAPYSVRPHPAAPVSMPLHWDEVKKGLNPKQFNIKNALERLKSEGDLFKPVLGKGINLSKLLGKKVEKN